ncbi:MAG: hypothetical protein RIS69_1656, partial [Actinomycetota bacterium]
MYVKHGAKRCALPVEANVVFVR